MILKIFLIILIIIEIYYWFFYFPKAWKEESNWEIQTLKHGLKYWYKHCIKGS